MVRPYSSLLVAAIASFACVPETYTILTNDGGAAGGTFDASETGGSSGGSAEDAGTSAGAANATAGNAGSGNVAIRKLVIQPGSEAGQDSYVLFTSGAENTENFGRDDSLLATAWNTKASPTEPGAAAIRSFIYFRFDLSALPKGAAVQSVKLSLYANPEVLADPDNEFALKEIGHSTYSGENDFWIETVLEPWDEATISFATAALATLHTLPNLESDEALHFESTRVFNQDLELDVTRLVQSALTRGDAYYGFMLHLNEQTEFRKLRFASSEYPNPARRPKLEIEFRAP